MESLLIPIPPAFNASAFVDICPAEACEAAMGGLGRPVLSQAFFYMFASCFVVSVLLEPLLSLYLHLNKRQITSGSGLERVWLSAVKSQSIFTLCAALVLYLGTYLVQVYGFFRIAPEIAVLNHRYFRFIFDMLLCSFVFISCTRSFMAKPKRKLHNSSYMVALAMGLVMVFREKYDGAGQRGAFDDILDVCLKRGVYGDAAIRWKDLTETVFDQKFSYYTGISVVLMIPGILLINPVSTEAIAQERRFFLFFSFFIAIIALMRLALAWHARDQATDVFNDGLSPPFDFHNLIIFIYWLKPVSKSLYYGTLALLRSLHWMTDGQRDEADTFTTRYYAAEVEEKGLEIEAHQTEAFSEKIKAEMQSNVGI